MANVRTQNCDRCDEPFSFEVLHRKHERLYCDPCRIRGHAKKKMSTVTANCPECLKPFDFQHYEGTNPKRYCGAWCSTRASARRANWGITCEQWHELLRGQNYCCKICTDPLDFKAKFRIHVDHDHVSGVIRGILCSNCNRGLGFFKDTPEILLEAAAYLRQREQDTTPVLVARHA